MCSVHQCVVLVFLSMCFIGSETVPVEVNRAKSASDGDIKEYITEDGEPFEVQKGINDAQTNCDCYCRSKWGDGYWSCCECHFVESGCFPSTATVLSESGDTIKMASLEVGTRVKTVDEKGKLIDTKVLGFLHRSPKDILQYITLTTQSGHSITLSQSHVIFAAKSNNPSAIKPRFAAMVEIGDFVNVTLESTEKLIQSIVTNKTELAVQGAYVPFTEQGTVIVNGVLASIYASFDHEKSHYIMAPLRWIPQLTLDSNGNGVALYVKMAKAVARAIQYFGIY